MNNRSTLPRPPASYWWCQVGGWSAFLLLNVATTQAFNPVTGRVLASFVWISAFGICLTHGLRALILRRGWIELPIARLIPRVLGTNLLLACLLVSSVWLYFTLVPQPAVGDWAKTGRTLAAANFVFVFNDFIILTLWAGIYFGVAYFKRQRRLEIERYQTQTALAEAELRGLKSQLNPHFLFNSLNSLRALISENPARAQTAVTQLAAILRYHLQSGERSVVPLAQELEMVEQYLALELIRFEDRLSLEREIDPLALGYSLPPLALQTLLENAVKYGVSRESGAAVIQLRATLGEERLLVSVRNTGRLLTETATGSTGLGLTNLQTRLRLLFAERATFQLHEPEAGWVEARLDLPAVKA